MSVPSRRILYPATAASSVAAVQARSISVGADVAVRPVGTVGLTVSSGPTGVVTVAGADATLALPAASRAVTVYV